MSIKALTVQILSKDSEQRNFEKNKLDYIDRRFHDWYRFVLSFPPHLVRQYLREFRLTSDDLVLDPFCGTGTTLVESKLQNISSIGIEANSFAHFASTVKTDWDVDKIELQEISKRIYNKTLSKLAQSGITDNPSQNNLKIHNLKGFSEEQNRVILKNCISPLPLHKSLLLLEQINSYKSTPYYKYLALALGNSAVNEYSNLRFGPEVGLGKIKEDSAVLAPWFEEISKIISDLQYSTVLSSSAEARVLLSDSRNIKSQLNDCSVSAVITSPPYPNEKDYTRTTRLESVLLGFVNNIEELRILKKSLLRSNTRGIYKGDNDDEFITQFPKIQKIADEIENRRIELGKTSGFEKLYPKVTKLYFGGIARHLLELQSILKPNAHLAYVVGDQASYLRVMIRTGQIIGEIAEYFGYELVRIDLFRTRFSTATKTNLNEEVVILRWPG